MLHFSIIIPVYNVAPYLRECLDSVLKQTFTGWEAICIDDGSTDGSGVILDEYAAKDKRFKVIHQANAGVSAARNAGLKAIHYDWVLFLDGDDVWNINALDECAKLIKSHPDAQIIRFGRERFNEKFIIDNGSELLRTIVTIRSVDKQLSEHDMVFSFVCNCCHRSVIPMYGFKDYAYGEDLVFRAECLLLAKKIVETSQILYGYRKRFGSATESPINKRRLIDRIAFSLDWLDIIQQKPVPSIIVRRIVQGLTESFLVDLITLEKESQKEIWDEWYNMLPNLLLYKQVGVWYRFVSIICLKTRSRRMAYLFCVIPLRLRRMVKSFFLKGV